MDKIFFLIDTNIFIQLEDHQILKDAFTKFHRLCNENSVVICIHPLSKKEIQKDKDNRRRENILSKIEKYKIIKDPPTAKESTLRNSFGEIKSSNDKFDCQLLYALQQHTVSFLVTEDTGIHQRAKRVSLKKKVLTIDQANDALERFFPEKIRISLPNIEYRQLYNVDIDDTIFDSLKEDYPDFQQWLERCLETQVEAWVVKNLGSNKIESICIHKEANDGDYAKYNLPRKSLKLATFKVDELYRGKKLGELMLKQAFLYAIKNNFKACWMTVFPKHNVLIDFIKDFGFYEIGTTNLKDKKRKEKELVFQKTFIKSDNFELEGLDYHIKYFPFYDDRDSTEKYIIPIKKEYYEILFPEEKSQQSFPGMEKEIPGNTIKKVYLCHASIRKLKRGDLLFFYVSSPVQSIVSIGIVESTFRSRELSEVVSYIGKRSVYFFSEIKKMIEKELLVIEFRFVKHLKQEITLSQLEKQKIIKGPPQSIQELENYKKFKQMYLNI